MFSFIYQKAAVQPVTVNRSSPPVDPPAPQVFGPGGLLTSGNERPVNISHLTASGETAVPIYFSFPSRYSEGYAIEIDSFIDHVQGA